ncbi:MAG TPA: pyridoxal phosphate-dependent aminotransferase [Sporichthyaceae bacterium]|jgi:N-succinyldiaminopimelate aminotransferase
MGRARAASRLDGLGTTIFAEMSALAVATASINLGQGFPDTDGPPEIIEAAVTALRGGVNQYPPGPGIPALRAAIAAHDRRFHGLRYDPDTEVLVTTGATEAIAAAVLGLVEPGDEVIALEPYYDSYAANIAMAGGVRVPVTLRPPDFRLDLDRLRDAVTRRTRAILLNTPHNPTGAVLNTTELQGIADLCLEHDLVVIADEVYEHLVFDGVHTSIASLPGMRQRTVRISSAGKTFSFTGWKIGWACAPPDLLAAVRGAKQFLTYVSGAPFQPAIAEALALPDSYFTRLREGLRERRDQLAAGLAELGLGVFVPAGTYFLTTDVRPLGYSDGIAFCRDLPGRAGVVAIPTGVFYDDKAAGAPLVRWAFCKRAEVLAAAIERLAAAFG